ncbi:WG repeat-containing protein [Paludibaculum fermentans]|uniref:WG repeat-containing protein n=1 Tax=Paludibaculum fermentans TaxID=1473598 RepID=UPI003EB9AA12
MISRAITLATWSIAACWACSYTDDLSKRPGAGPLFKIYRAGKFGYMDRGGNVVIAPRFDEARDFFHGLAAVRLNGKVGFVNERDQLVIPARFDDARDFLEELAPVRLGRLWGYIDTRGNMAIQPRFQGAGEFHQGLARIYVWTTITFDYRGNRTQFTRDTAPLYVFNPPYENPCGFARADDGKFGFIDRQGSIVIPPRFSYADEFHEGLSTVCLEECHDFSRAKHAVINRHGHIAFPVTTESVGDFSAGLASFRVGEHYGFLDRTGRVAIAPQYQYVGDFHDGLARVQQGWQWGYIDTTGRQVIPPQFRSVGDFSEGLAVACNSVCTYIDRTGSRALNVFGNSSIGRFSDGLAPVMEYELFTWQGLFAQLRIRLLRQQPGVVYIDKSGAVAGLYGR